MVVLAVGMMAGIVNAQEMTQDFGVENFPFDTSFHTTGGPITHTGTGITDLGFEAQGYESTNSGGFIGVFANQFDFAHFSSNGSGVPTPALDPIWGVAFDNMRSAYIRFVSVDLVPGSSLTMSLGERVGATNTNDDDVVIRVYLNGEESAPGFGTDIFDTRPDTNGTLDPGDAVGGATYEGTTLFYDFADTDTSVILYVAVFTDDAGDGYYIDDVRMGKPNVLRPIYPEDGGWVVFNDWGGYLEWQRYDPNGVDDVPPPYNVDVYFGINDPPLPTDRVEENEDVDISTNVPDPLIDQTRYYWRIDSYEPNQLTGLIDIVKGPLWYFDTVVPAEVYATETDETPGNLLDPLTVVSEEGPTSDTIILSLSKDPLGDVLVTLTEMPPILTTSKETVESYDGSFPPELQITLSDDTSIVAAIAATNDDIEESIVNGTLTGGAGSTDLEIFTDGPELRIGLRFDSVAIPPGATIKSAIVEFAIDETEATGGVYGIITGENVDNAPGFGVTSPGDDWRLRDRLAANPTTATSSLVWTKNYAIGTKVQTMDLSSIIQEIVSRTGWVENNSIVLFLEKNTGNHPLDLQEPIGTYTLNSSNWDGVTDPVIVSIAAFDDDILEIDPEIASVAITTSSTPGSDWDGLTTTPIAVTVLENECGAWPFSMYDRDLNCVIDLSDFAMFAAEWLACTMPNDTLGICVDSR